MSEPTHLGNAHNLATQHHVVVQFILKQLPCGAIDFNGVISMQQLLQTAACFSSHDHVHCTSGIEWLSPRQPHYAIWRDLGHPAQVRLLHPCSCRLLCNCGSSKCEQGLNACVRFDEPTVTATSNW